MTSFTALSICVRCDEYPVDILSICILKRKKIKTILATRDGGEHWFQQKTDSTTTFLDVFLTDAQAGWVVGTQGAMFHTITGGEKWIDRTRPCGSPCIRPADLLRVRFTNQQSGWVVGERGAFLYTSDAGFTWLEPELPNPISLYGLAFPTSREGWAVGEQGTILKITSPPS